MAGNTGELQKTGVGIGLDGDSRVKTEAGLKCSKGWKYEKMGIQIRLGWGRTGRLGMITGENWNYEINKIILFNLKNQNM